MEIFGYEFKKAQAEPVSFTPPPQDDGAVVVAAGGVFGTTIDLDGTIRTEAELVTKYREMTLHAEIDHALDEITNDAIVVEDDNEIISIVLDKIDANVLPPKIKQVIEQEFKNIVQLLEFNTHAYQIFRRWYIDGRIYYHAIIDEKQPDAGIIELRYIDPRKIRKVREVSKKRSPQLPAEAVLQKTTNEYFVYNDKGFNYDNRTATQGASVAATGLKIAKDAIVHIPSGLLDPRGTTVLSYLHKAIKPLNQLRALEDATVIYRISRAPERRIFYIDVGNLPQPKAEQYVRDIMVKQKNKLVYDSATGEIRDDRKFMTMLEDYYLARREGGKGTEIATLPGLQNVNNLEDVIYFQKKLFRSLNVPIGRIDEEQIPFGPGKSGEITRDEVNFARFIDRIRLQFNRLFLEILKKQLVLKNIMTVDDWDRLTDLIKFKYARDNYFAELKEKELFNIRMQTLAAVDPQGPYVGKYYSVYWIRKNLLQQTEDDMEMIDDQIIDEMNNPLYHAELMSPPDEPYDEQGGTIPPTEEVPEPKETAEDSGPAKKKPSGKKTSKPSKDKKSTIKDQAQRLGLTYIGFGRYKNGSGKITHVSKGGVLQKFAGKSSEDK